MPFDSSTTSVSSWGTDEIGHRQLGLRLGPLLDAHLVQELGQLLVAGRLVLADRDGDHEVGVELRHQGGRAGRGR